MFDPDTEKVTPAAGGRPVLRLGLIRRENGGAKGGNRTPDLLDANESRYQLRHSPGRSTNDQPGATLAALPQWIPNAWTGR